MKIVKLLFFQCFFTIFCNAQEISITGTISSEAEPVPFASIYLKNTQIGTSSDENGFYELSGLRTGKQTLLVSVIGYIPFSRTINLNDGETKFVDIELIPSTEALDEMVVTGTLKAVSRSESPVPVEVYSPTFLKKNPTASIFEALQNVNGVRPQINCNVCNTGDIHINGLEGPYTLVLIDGMPIVSGLGTVYGLTGIPNSLIEQIEIVKGPASSVKIA